MEIERDLVVQRQVLEALHHGGDLLGLVSRLGVHRHLLHVVDEDHQALVAGELLVLLDEGSHVLDGAGGLRPTQQVQVGSVAVDTLQRGAQAGVGAEVGVLAAGRHPRAQDLLAHVDELDATAAAGHAGQHGLLRDETVEQVLLVVLEADVEHAGEAAHDDVACHLQRHRGLAGALGAADEEHLTSADAAADGLVQGRESEWHRLILGDVTLRHLAGQGRQHVCGAAGLDVADARVVLPGLATDGLVGVRDGTRLLRRESRLRQAWVEPDLL